MWKTILFFRLTTTDKKTVTCFRVFNVIRAWIYKGSCSDMNALGAASFAAVRSGLAKGGDIS